MNILAQKYAYTSTPLQNKEPSKIFCQLFLNYLEFTNLDYKFFTFLHFKQKKILSKHRSKFDYFFVNSTGAYTKSRKS